MRRTARGSRATTAALLVAAACAPGVGGAQSGPAAGTGPFSAAFTAALAGDATYQAARHELAAREQDRPLARAALLPTVNATYSESRVRGERDSPNVLGQEFTQTLDFRNPVTALQLRAPLFNADAWLRLRSAETGVEGSRALFAARGLELLDRLGSAYAQRLFAEQALALAQAQVEVLQAQLDSAERRFARGEGTRTEVADAAAGLALARVQRLEAADQRDLAERTLARVTGGGALPLRGLPEDFSAPPLPADNAEAWVEQALARSPALQARRLQLDLSRNEVRRSRAAHLPRLDLVASAVDARNDSLSTLNQRSRQVSAGVQLVVPLFAGLGVEAGVEQALAQSARSEAELDNDRTQLALDVRRQFQLAQSGRLKLEALNEALVASALALEGTRRGLAAGLRTQAEVLEAVRRVFQTRRDLVQARYEWLLARLRLQALAGATPAEVVADMDRQLTGPLVAAAVMPDAAAGPGAGAASGATAFPVPPRPPEAPR